MNHIISLSITTILFGIGMYIPATTLSYEAEEEPYIPSPSTEGLLDKAVEKYGVDKEILTRVIECESQGFADAVGALGEIGLVQILPSAHPTITKEQMLDPAFSVDFLASEIANGRGWQWTCYNKIESAYSCVKAVRKKVPNLPKGNAEDFEPNSNLQDGNVVILEYSGLRHIAYKEEIVFDGVRVYEGNFKRGVEGYRLITWEELHEHLIGFYVPTSTVATSGTGVNHLASNFR